MYPYLHACIHIYTHSLMYTYTLHIHIHHCSYEDIHHCYYEGLVLYIFKIAAKTLTESRPQTNVDTGKLLSRFT